MGNVSPSLRSTKPTELLRLVIAGSRRGVVCSPTGGVGRFELAAFRLSAGNSVSKCGAFVVVELGFEDVPAGAGFTGVSVPAAGPPLTAPPMMPLAGKPLGSPRETGTPSGVSWTFKVASVSAVFASALLRRRLISRIVISAGEHSAKSVL